MSIPKLSGCFELNRPLARGFIELARALSTVFPHIHGTHAELTVRIKSGETRLEAVVDDTVIGSVTIDTKVEIA